MTFLVDPVGVVTDGMTFRDRCGALDGSVCDCGDWCDGSPGYWNDDDPDGWVVDPVGCFWPTLSVLSPMK